MAVLDAKASYFEENNYKDVSVQDLTALLAWHKIPKEKLKMSDMVAWWKEICNNHVPPPKFERWTSQDEEELEQLKTVEIDMAETALGRYVALMKRTAVAYVLDFTDEEWESLVALKEADAANRSNTAVANAMDNVAGGLLTENEMIGDESGVV